jgi:hypothetical protein
MGISALLFAAMLFAGVAILTLVEMGRTVITMGVEAVKPTEDEKPLLYMTAEQAVYGPGRTGCDCLQPNGCASYSSVYAV